jgi:hypothetical protein
LVLFSPYSQKQIFLVWISICGSDLTKLSDLELIELLVQEVGGIGAPESIEAEMLKRMRWSVECEAINPRK